MTCCGEVIILHNVLHEIIEIRGGRGGEGGRECPILGYTLIVLNKFSVFCLRYGYLGGGVTPYVLCYSMLSYTWVVFEKFTVLFSAIWVPFSTKCLLFPQSGYLLTKIAVFVVQDGYPFARNFLYCSTKWLLFMQKICVFFCTYKLGIFSRDLLKRLESIIEILLNTRSSL